MVNESALDDKNFILEPLSNSNSSSNNVIYHPNCICKPSSTPVPTSSPAPTNTPNPSQTKTPTPTPSITSSVTPTPTNTPTTSATPPASPCPPCPSQTPPSTPCPSQSLTPTQSPSQSLTPTPTPTLTQNCCDWDGNGFLDLDTCRDNVAISFTKIGPYTWRGVLELDGCGTMVGIITCNPSSPASPCANKWSAIFTVSCASNLVVENPDESCSCNVPPVWKITGDFTNCYDCCTPTPTRTPTVTPTPSLSYYYAPLFINIIP